MNTNQFDQHIESMFANETVQPSNDAEAALFDRLAALESRKRKYQLLGSLIFAGTILWLGAHVMADEVSAPSETEAVVLETKTSPSENTDARIPAPEKSSGAIEGTPLKSVISPVTIEGAVAVQETPVMNAEIIVLDSHFSTSTDVVLLPIEPVPSPPAAGVKVDKSLLESSQETWVLPAVVTVKD
tara:strand:+ start:10076 stop:10633 length:558 start_codon:yes stop_codon:yes gene_type:complete